MKKMILIFSTILFCAVSFAENFSAQVVSVSGKAEVLRENTWTALNEGDTLSGGDTIQTGFKSSLTLKIKESTVNVAALTRITVENLSQNSEKDNAQVFVRTGKVTSNVQKTEGKKVNFVVRTPVATASVRGTEFSVSNGFSSTQVETTRGAVAVWSGKNTENANLSSQSEDSLSAEEAAETLDSLETESLSFESAPYGTVLVTQNQGTNFSKDGNSGSQKEFAQSGISNIGSGTQTLSDSRLQEDKGEKIKKASLTVNITVEE